MEYLWLIYAIASFAFLLYGMTLSIGFGWAMFIIELLGGSVTTDYMHAQRDFPPTKDQRKKYRGVACIFIGILFALLAFATV